MYLRSPVGSFVLSKLTGVVMQAYRNGVRLCGSLIAGLFQILMMFTLYSQFLEMSRYVVPQLVHPKPGLYNAWRICLHCDRISALSGNTPGSDKS
jgi:hypothetical protein